MHPSAPRTHAWTERDDNLRAVSSDKIGRNARQPAPTGIPSDVESLPTSHAFQFTSCARVTADTFDDLLRHPREVRVLPIVGNASIAPLPSIRFRSQALGFDPTPPAEVFSMANEDLQSFLGSVYNSLNASPSSSRGLGRATHVLGYMYLICQNSRLANILVNSSMMPLLLRLAQLQDSDVDAFKRHAERRSAPKPENVRARVAVVLAVLIRHSTYIAPAMCTYDEGGMLAALEALAKDAAPKVRRYGMAALCELIFYITTNAAAEEAQRRERSGSADGVHDATNLEWRVPASLLRLLVKTTRDPADAVLRACAVKTIENIMMSAAMGEVPAAATFLASHETLGHLRTIATSKSLPKDVRCSACNALCSLVRVDLKLMPVLLRERDGASSLVDWRMTATPHLCGGRTST